MNKNYRTALTIAGSDSSGGAGIQADLKTFSALGCYGMSVITALTAQNTQGVNGIFNVSPDFVRNQIESIFTDIQVNAVKIGMLSSSEIVETVSDCLSKYGGKNIVLDPVMVAKSSDALLQKSAVETLKNKLLPLVDLVTPNLPEASILLERKIETRDEIAKASSELLRFGCKAVLIKGGHLNGPDSPDCFVTSKDSVPLWLEASRIQTGNTHGTGCTLSSAIAVFLAHGKSLEESVHSAKGYLTKALDAGKSYRLGHSHGPVHHFHSIWPQ